MAHGFNREAIVMMMISVALSAYVCSDGKNKYFVLGQRISLSNLLGEGEGVT